MFTGERIAHDRPPHGWHRHVVGVGLGLLVVAALIGHARLTHELQTIGSREFVLWPHGVAMGLVFLWGIVLVIATRAAPRLPALPTVVALVLLYGAAGSIPVLSRALRLPPSFLGPWQPRMASVVGGESSYQWQGDMLMLTAGMMTAAAVWGWWRYVRTRQHRLEPDYRSDTPGTVR